MLRFLKPKLEERWRASFVLLRRVAHIYSDLLGIAPMAAVALPVCLLLQGPLPAVSLYATKRLIDRLAALPHIGPGYSDVVWYLSLIAGAILLQQLLNSVGEHVEIVARLKLHGLLQRKLLERSARLDLETFENPECHDAIRRAQQEVPFRPMAVLSQVVNIIRGTGATITFAAVLAHFHWMTVLYGLVLALPALVTQVRYGRKMFGMMYYRTPHEREALYITDVLTGLSDAKEVRLFGIAPHLLERWWAMFSRFEGDDRQLSGRRTVEKFAASATEAVGTLAFYAYILYRVVLYKDLTVGDFLFYPKAFEGMMGAFRSTLSQVGILYEHNLFLGNLYDALALPVRGRVAPSSAEGTPMRALRNRIRFVGVTYCFPQRSTPAVHGVSFVIDEGEIVGLVGANGAGKSTVVKLLTGLYRPTEGSIYVDNAPLASLDVTEWQRRIGVVFQDFSKYWFSARDNIAFGDIDGAADMGRLRECAMKSGILDRIESARHGWETRLGRMFDEGEELSTGEWQRLAIARGLLRDARVLILDEPTASLDPRQEHEVFELFRKMAAGRTTILVSHRLGSVRMADRILVLDHGRLIEEGSHDALCAKGGEYARMFEMQSRLYQKTPATAEV